MTCRGAWLVTLGVLCLAACGDSGPATDAFEQTETLCPGGVQFVAYHEAWTSRGVLDAQGCVLGLQLAVEFVDGDGAHLSGSFGRPFTSGRRAVGGHGHLLPGARGVRVARSLRRRVGAPPRRAPARSAAVGLGLVDREPDWRATPTALYRDAVRRFGAGVGPEPTFINIAMAVQKPMVRMTARRYWLYSTRAEGPVSHTVDLTFNGSCEGPCLAHEFWSGETRAVEHALEVTVPPRAVRVFRVVPHAPGGFVATDRHVLMGPGVVRSVRAAAGRADEIPLAERIEAEVRGVPGARERCWFVPAGQADVLGCEASGDGLGEVAATRDASTGLCEVSFTGVDAGWHALTVDSLRK